MNDKDILPEKDLLEKAATMNRFEYSPLGKELKAQTDIAKKKSYENDKTISKKPTRKKYSKSDLTYDANHSFYKYFRDNRIFNNLSFKSEYSFLVEFFNDLDKLNKLKTQKEKTEKKKTNDKALELYNDFLDIYFD